MYGYMPQHNQQGTIDRITNQIKELETLRAQFQAQANMQQPTNLTQNFQIAPTNNTGIRFANNIQDVEKELVFAITPFFTNDLSQMWLKNAKGEIKTYQLTEIVKKDDKDILIESLQAQIEELKKGNVTNEPSNTDANEQPTTKTNDK